MFKLVFVFLVLLFPIKAKPKNVFDVTFYNLDASKIAALVEAPEFVQRKMVGRIGEVKIHVEDDDIRLVASKFRIPSDPVSKIEVKGNTKTGIMTVKAYALGGLIEYTGNVPQLFEVLSKFRVPVNRTRTD